MKRKSLRLKRAVRAALLVLLLSAAGLTNALAQTFTQGNLTYSLNNDGASVTVTGHVDGTAATGELVIPESVELYGTTYPVTVIGSSAFTYCSGLTGDLVIPNSVVTIGSYAFQGCYGFTGSLTLGDAVQTISYSAFSDCYGFTGSLTLGDAVQTIGDHAFRYCYGFTGSLTIPESVNYIGSQAFDYCRGFTTLNYNATNCSVSNNWLLYNSGSYSWTTLNIGENVQTIPNYFLSNRTSFTGELVIPESVTSIGTYAFNGCTGFTESLNIGDAVTSIGERAFNGCSGFTGSLNLGNAVTTIGANAFNGCTGFTGSLTIPNSVTSIGANAFSGCTGFSDTLTLGLSVTQIGNTAFFGACQGFTTFEVKTVVPPTLGNNVFVSMDYDIPVTVPCGSVEAYEEAQGWTVFNNIQATDPCQWTITASANPNVGGTVSGAGTYDQGQTCTLTATPQGYFEFQRWTENGVEVSTDAEYTFTVEGNRNLVAQFFQLNYIYFADPNVEARCLELWDSDGDGYLSYEEAAAVTNLGQAFRDNDNITSFNELQYFTGLTALNSEEFYDCDYLTSIILPEGLTSIGSYAFHYCYRLATVVFPESLTSIGYSAFGNCTALTSVTFPESLTSIGYYAFYDCTALTSVTFPESLTSIGYYAFQGCTALTSVTFPESLTSIGAGAFKYCNALSTINAMAVVPPTIGSEVFNGCNIYNIVVNVPCNTTNDYRTASGWDAFINYQESDDCEYEISVAFSPEEAGVVTGTGIYQRGEIVTLTATPAEGRNFICWMEDGEVVLQDSIYSFIADRSRHFGAVFSALPTEIISFLDANVKAICVEHWDLDGDGELSYSEAAAVTNLGNWFQGNTQIVMFHELQYFIGLPTIPANAFRECTGLNFITLPNNLTSIGNYAFYNCYGLIGGLTIPDSVVTIGDYAFYGCTGFMGLLTLGESVQTIGNYAFYDCHNFTGSIVIPNSVVTIGDFAFYGSTAYWGTLTLGESVRTIGSYAFSGCNGLVGDLVIPNSVTTIGEYAFYDCHSMAGTLTIGNAVTTIGSSAFRECYNLTGDLVIPNSVTTIGDYAFYDCYSFAGTLSLGNSLVTIGSYAFCDCYNLVGDIEIPNSVTLIGTGAFAYCHRFTGSLTIPSSVTSIGNGAFFNCSGFSEVNYMVTSHSDISASYNYDPNSSPPFRNCGGHLNIGDNVIMIPANMFRRADFTGTLTIPNSVITIRDYAFYYCNQLTGTLVFPNSMNTIGVNAFQYCTGITEVIMGINLMIVGNRSFSNCTGLQKVILPDVVTVIGIEAFRYCSQLSEINMQAPEAPSIGWDVFADNAEGRIITIPCGTMANYSEGYWSEWADALVEMCDDNLITVVVSPEEAGSATGGGYYDYSQICTLTATSNIGYPFINWTRNGVVVSTERVYSFGVTETCTYVANFSPEPVSYDIVVATNMQEGGTADGAGSYLYGATVTLTATESEGYHFVNWTLGGSVVSTEATYSFEAEAPGTYTANFEPNNYDIVAEANPTEGGTVTGAGVYGHNTTVVLSATANTGYTFINWTKEGEEVSVEQTYSFTATEEGTYVANFELNTYEIIAEANPTEGGTVEGAGTYGHGTTATLTAIGNEGYPFLNWTKDGEVVSATPTYTFTVTEAGTYVANFTATPVSYQITATANPEAGGTIAGAGTYYYGAIATLTATPNEHYYFVDWTKDGEEVSTDTLVSFIVTEAADYEAHFALYSFTVELAATPEEGGSVAGGGTFDYGETVTVTATPMPGYHFVSWTENGEEVSTEADYSFSIEADRLLTANFVRNVYLIAVGVNPLHSGVITGSEPSYYGDTLTLIATANEGYAFVNWMRNDTVVSTQPSYSFIVTYSCTMTANFELVNITQSTGLGEGWNWYSSYIELSGIDGLGQMESSLGNNGIVIKSRNDGFVESYEYNGTTGWFGALANVCNEQMYMIQTNAACNMSITGYAAYPDEHPITIEDGWNWIGFPSVYAVNLETALEGFAPENNDIIKSRDGFTTYFSEGGNSMWYGSLNSFEPGKGYMYKSNSTEPKVLTFQSGRGETVLANIVPEGNVFSPRGESFARNMAVMAVVDFDGEEIRSEDYELAVFVGDQCRGSMKLMYVAPMDRYVAFLTVFGETGETLSFRLTDGTETALSDNALVFVADGVTGTLAEPYVVRFRGTTGIGEDAMDSVKVYPNPSKGVYNVEGQGIRSIQVFDGLGQLILSEENGNDFMQIDLGNRANGIYVLRVVTIDGVKVQQLIKQ